MNKLSEFSTEELFVEIFKRMLKERHPDWNENDLEQTARNGYFNSDDEIEEIYRRIDDTDDYDNCEFEDFEE